MESVERVLGINGCHKSEVMYHKWHLVKDMMIVKGSVKTIHNFSGPLNIKG